MERGSRTKQTGVAADWTDDGRKMMATWTSRSTQVAPSAKARGKRSCRRSRSAKVRSCASLPVADVAFSAATVVVLPVYATMLVAPKWRVTKAIVSSPVPYVALAGLYLWTVASIGGMEKLASVLTGKLARLSVQGAAGMLARKEEVAIVWIHFVLIDLFTARHIYLDGIRNGIFMAHSLVLCLMACPLGILSHYVTKSIAGHFRRKDQDTNPTPDPSR
eukprot:scaffold2846_cov322-Pavlova_lutheri.AAC.35